MSRSSGQRELIRQRKIAEFARDEKPVIQELRRLGTNLEHIEDLRDFESVPAGTVQTLVKWLHATRNLDVKECIAAILAMPWSSPSVATDLLDEFESLPDVIFGSPIRWTLASTISCIADSRVLERVARLAGDQKYGKDREMLALAIANMMDPCAVSVLTELLDDPMMTLHALAAFQKCGKRAKAALETVKRFTDHPDPNVAREAKKAVKAIMR